MKTPSTQTTKKFSPTKRILIAITAFAIGGVAVSLGIAENKKNTASINSPVKVAPEIAQTAPPTQTNPTAAPGTAATATPPTIPTTTGATPKGSSPTSIPMAITPQIIPSATTTMIDATKAKNPSEIISSVLEAVRKGNDMPGMAAAVIQGGKIIGVGATGVRKRNETSPVLRDDQFHLGSCSKAFTATLIGILVDEGKLNWDSTISDLIGRELTSMNPDYAGVTIDQLLHHRSGAWPNGPSEVWKAAQYAKGTPTQQRQIYVEGILSQPPKFAPGQYLYSNAGYATLGFIAETITNTPYEQLMEQKVFLPLGLKSAGFGNAGNANELTAPYPHSESGTANFIDNPEAITPAGRIHMNMMDWAKFCLFHLGHQTNPPLLKPQTLEHLHTLAGEVAQDKSGYACGWMRPNRDWAGGRTLHHAGSNMMNYCAVWLSPQKDFGVLVATNQGGKQADIAVQEACQTLIEFFMSTPQKK